MNFPLKTCGMMRLIGCLAYFGGRTKADFVYKDDNQAVSEVKVEAGQKGARIESPCPHRSVQRPQAECLGWEVRVRFSTPWAWPNTGCRRRRFPTLRA